MHRDSLSVAANYLSLSFSPLRETFARLPIRNLLFTFHGSVVRFSAAVQELSEHEEQRFEAEERDIFHAAEQRRLPFSDLLADAGMPEPRGERRH